MMFFCCQHKPDIMYLYHVVSYAWVSSRYGKQVTHSKLLSQVRWLQSLVMPHSCADIIVSAEGLQSPCYVQ